MNRFVAIDIETANASMASICQIGLVAFEDGKEVAAESRLVDPETWFDPINISIHGLDEQKVRGASTFSDVHEWLCAWSNGQIVVCHTHFDRAALFQACNQHALSTLSCSWLDSARVARRTWPQFAQRGYGLKSLADHCGVSFKHHDALHDARTAGIILARAVEHSGIALSEWLVRSVQSVSSQSVKRQGDGDGALVGEFVVFTGALIVPRRVAADRAAEAGADVQPSVTKTTTLLVVGDQDIEKLAGKAKSSKHLKAEQLISCGQSIRIIGETDFLALSAVAD